MKTKELEEIIEEINVGIPQMGISFNKLGTLTNKKNKDFRNDKNIKDICRLKYDLEDILKMIYKIEAID